MATINPQSAIRNPQSPVGFLTDTTLCIGCKACEVACKQWNGLPLDNLGFTGNSYDNTGDLGAETWRHVAFVEQLGEGAEVGQADGRGRFHGATFTAIGSFR